MDTPGCRAGQARRAVAGWLAGWLADWEGGGGGGGGLAERGSFKWNECTFGVEGGGGGR